MIFVFGSNLAGRHGAGAALYAWRYHGAKIGEGIGRTGNAYAIPTKGYDYRYSLDLVQIKKHVGNFLQYARNNPGLVFEVTRIGCGLAGYDDSDIAPMFKGVTPNCVMPKEWAEWL